MYNRNRRGGGWYPNQQGGRKPSTFVSFEGLESETLVTLSAYDTNNGRMATLCVYKLSDKKTITGIRVWEETRRETNMPAADGLAMFNDFVNGKAHIVPADEI